MKKGIILFLVLLGLNSYGMTGQEYLEKVNANYSNLSSFELLLDYRLYKGHNGKELKDQYESTFLVDGKSSHRRIYDDEIITSEDLSLVMNHDLRTIQILPAIQEQIISKDITKSLSHCQDIKVSETENGKQISITFKDFSSLAYARIDLVIDDNYWIKNMTLYYATQLNYSTDYFNPIMDYPRLEVDYKKLKKTWKDKEGITNIGNYILEENGKYKPTSLYQNYQIIQ